MNAMFKKILSTPWFALIVIALAAFIVYSNVYHCPFVFDDDHTIVRNTRIRDLSNFSSPGKFLTARTVVDFTFALNYRFGKLDVFGYHLVNILIHIVNGFVVYFLAFAILRLLARTEGGGQRAEDSGQRAEDRGQRAEDRGQQTAD